MSEPKCVIELTPLELENLMSVLIDLKRSNVEEATRTIANGDCGQYLERLISRDSVLQHLFTLALYAKKVGESELSEDEMRYCRDDVLTCSSIVPWEGGETNAE